MKNVIVLFLLCNLIAGYSFSQSPTGKVTVKRDVSRIVHEYKPTDVLWVGLANRIRVEAGDSTVKRLLVNVDHGRVEQKGEDFMITVDTPGVIKMTVYNYTDLGNPKMIETVSMKAVRPAELFPTFTGKRGGDISQKELTSAKSLETECPECKNETYEITSFQILISGKEYQTYLEDVQGDKLTDKLKHVLATLPKGTNIMFQYIKARSTSDMSVRTMHGISFTVAD